MSKLIKYYLSSIFMGLIHLAQGQIIYNYDSISTDRPIKMLTTYYHDSEDTTSTESQIIKQLAFNAKGLVDVKYALTLWDVVSYSHTTYYTYDERGNLIDRTAYQKILNLGKRDQDHIDFFGDDPIHTKNRYSYDSLNRMVREVEYLFRTEKMDPSEKPSSKKTYSYNAEGQLYKKTVRTLVGGEGYNITTTTYFYDKSGRLEQEKTRSKMTSGLKVASGIFYVYENGRLERQIHSNDSFGQFNFVKRFEYDEFGNQIKVFKTSGDNPEKLIKEIKYDKQGKRIHGDGNTTFTYYPNGLIKQQRWESPTSESVWQYFTMYEFY